MPRLKLVLKRLSLVGFGLGVAFLIIEIAMIVLEPWLLQGFYMYDRELGFRVRPHYHGTNAFGFNDDDYEIPKPSGTYRIVFLGDSFSWAGGRYENYVGVARRLLKDRYPERELEVINAGYPMTHTGEQLALLKKFVLQYEPDMVVLGFFAGNDFVDGAPHRKRIVLNETFLDIDRRQETVFLGYPILSKSRLLEFIKQKLKIFSEDVGKGAELSDPELMAAKNVAKLSIEQPAPATKPNAAPGSLPDDPLAPENVRAILEFLAHTCPPESNAEPTFSEESYRDIVKGRMTVCSNDAAELADNRVKIDYILGQLSEMVELLDQRGVKFMVGIYPSEFQVDEDLAAKIMTMTDREKSDYDLTRPQRILREWLDTRKVDHFDFYEIVKQANQVRRAYLSRDTHWNRFGNYVVGHAFFFLLSSRLP